MGGFTGGGQSCHLSFSFCKRNARGEFLFSLVLSKVVRHLRECKWRGRSAGMWTKPSGPGSTKALGKCATSLICSLLWVSPSQNCTRGDTGLNSHRKHRLGPRLLWTRRRETEEERKPIPDTSECKRQKGVSSHSRAAAPRWAETAPWGFTPRTTSV